MDQKWEIGVGCLGPARSFGSRLSLGTVSHSTVGYPSQSLEFCITLGHLSISAYISYAILGRCCLWCHSGITCSEILHHEQFLWLNWIANDFLAQTHHQTLLPWPYLSDLQSRAYIEINASFPQGFPVHIFTWGLHLALCSHFQRQQHSLFPSTAHSSDSKSCHCLCLEYRGPGISAHSLHEGSDEKQVMFPLCHRGNNNSNEGFVKTAPVSAVTNKQKD